MDEIEAPVTEGETRKGITGMKVGKSPGYDGFPSVFFFKIKSLLR